MDVELLRERAAAILLAHGAAFALVHGSRAAGSKPRADSDLDIAAYWAADPPAAWDVDLPAGVDLLVLNDAPLEVAGNIALYGQLLCESDEEARVNWVATTRRIWLDERARFERAHRDFLAAARG